MKSKRAGLLFALSLACAPEAVELDFPENHCALSIDCGSNTKCLPDLGMCAATKMEKPYTVVLQVSPNPNTTSGRFTWSPAIRLEMVPDKPLAIGPDNPLEIVLPRFVEVQGLLRCGDKPMRAEATFFPRTEDGVPIASGYPIAPVSVRSSASETTNFTINLPPNMTFDVNVQPLGPDSEVCPPFRTTFALTDASARFDPMPPSLETIAGRLVRDEPPDTGDVQETDSGEEPGGTQQVRIVNKMTGRVVSGTVEAQIEKPESPLGLAPQPPDADDGFVLNVIEDQQENAFLQVDLDPAHPWQEVIEIPLAAIKSDPGAIRVPVRPARVTLKGQVEFELKAIPDSTLTFVSSFPTNSPNTTSALNWCRLRSSVPSQVFCRAERSTTTVGFGSQDPKKGPGSFEISLLPGTYDVLISPGDRNAQGIPINVTVTRSLKLNVETTQLIDAENGGVQDGLVRSVNRAIDIGATYTDRNNARLPNITTRLQALSISRPGEPNDINADNRTVNAVSDGQGTFSTPLDTGFYDVLVKPPPDSGYSWLYFANREFKQAARYAVKLLPPLVVTGQVKRVPPTGNPDPKPLAQAAVDAYGIVSDRRTDGVRPVLIGTAITDDEGNFVLKLPPRIDDAYAEEALAQE